MKLKFSYRIVLTLFWVGAEWSTPLLILSELYKNRKSYEFETFHKNDLNRSLQSF